MTKEEFIINYKNKSNLNDKEFEYFMSKNTVLKCECEDIICLGWVMESNDVINNFINV